MSVDVAPTVRCLALPDHSEKFPSLVTARENLRTALTVEDAHGRVHYAHSAQDYAAEVAVDPASTREKRPPPATYGQSDGHHRSRLSHGYLVEHR